MGGGARYAKVLACKALGFNRALPFDASTIEGVVTDGSNMTLGSVLCSGNEVEFGECRYSIAPTCSWWNQPP